MIAGVDCVKYSDFLKEISEGDAAWAIVSAINFEECSLKLCSDILERCESADARRVKFFPLRLVSRRVNPWSALELVKDEFESRLHVLAERQSVPFGVSGVEYPAGQDVAFEILAKAQGASEHPPSLVLDVSALPRRFSVYLCDIVCGITHSSRRLNFSDIFIIQTPPERITSRAGLGPFSVGAARCVYNPELIRRLPESLKTSLLIFPGYEGFEAKAAVDAISGHHAMISVAVSCFDHSFPACMNVLIANQALLSDSVVGVIDIQYYFSELDALRVALDLVERSVNLCGELPHYTHAFLVAPFGPKWSIVISSLTRRAFLELCGEQVANVDAMTDTLILPTSQYVSLYSRGARTPCVFKITT